MDRKKKNSLYLIMITVSLLAAVLLTLAVWRYYVYYEEREYRDSGEAEEYQRHYVLIPENSRSVLWDDIYRSARAAAQQENAYLELLDDWEAGDYTTLDYLKLAVAAKVDGIILKPDGTAAMRSAMEEADEAGIPLIAVLNDDNKSVRKSFVGANTYQMGTVYGREIVRHIDENTRTILVLQRVDLSGKELIFKELKAAVQKEMPKDQKVEILEETILSGNVFDAEEVIRDILHDENSRPDILVCMNETDSESAYHTMIDYNLVGQVEIVGFYQTDTLLEAISKHTMPSVITIDTQQVGEACITALEEYNDMGYASSYYSVELDVINSENVEQYLQRGE